MSLIRKVDIRDESGNPFTSANALPVVRYDSAGNEITDIDINVRDESGNAFTNNNTLPVTNYDSSGNEVVPASEATLDALFNLTRILTEIIKNPNWLSFPNNALQVLTVANSVITTVTTVSTVTTVTGITNIGGQSADQLVINDTWNTWANRTRNLLV